MIQCQKCGQINAVGSNFCRACGNNFAVAPTPNSNDYEYTERQPYSWKTDEFQPVKTAARQSEQINRVQPLGNQTAPPPPFAAPLAFQQSHPLAQNYRCQRCASQYLPVIERRISTAGWIVFAALLIVFFPLFWIGFLIKEDVRACPVCHVKVG